MAKLTLTQILQAFGVDTNADTYDCTKLDAKTSDAIRTCLMASAGIEHLNHRISVAKSCALIWQKSIDDDCNELAQAHKKHNARLIECAEHKLMFSSIGFTNAREEIKFGA